MEKAKKTQRFMKEKQEQEETYHKRRIKEEKE